MPAAERERNVVLEFAALVNPSREDHLIRLPEAALAIARMEYPELDPEPYLAKLEALAQRVRSRSTRIGPVTTPWRARGISPRRGSNRTRRARS